MTAFTGNRSLALALVSVAQFVVVLDATAGTTALPAVGADLGAPLTRLQWVLSAYTLAFAGFLVVGGRVSDLLGARRAFAVALLGFTVASLACGLAPGLGPLVAARLVQGCARRCSPPPPSPCSRRSRDRTATGTARSPSGPRWVRAAARPAGSSAACSPSTPTGAGCSS